MGNNLHGASLQTLHFPYRIQLGRYATIDIDKFEFSPENLDPLFMAPIPIKKWIMLYKVDGSKCYLEFEKHFTTNGAKPDKTGLIIRDDKCASNGIQLIITKRKNNVLELDYTIQLIRHDPKFSFDTCQTQVNNTIYTETIVIDYGSGSKGGLVIIEKKKISKDEMPYMVTIAHYYAVSCGNFFGKSKIDIGLSAIVKIQASEDDTGLDFEVEGPTQHPATALFYMFDEVRKTGIWKPTSCPQCAKIKKQQQHNRMPWQQSETEDSDNFRPPRRNVPKQIGGSVIANDGAIKGNHNGNVIVRSRQSFFGRYWK
ncbi:hypothetical protein P8452_18690 [Trifolium repens]|nr:hypothetical protein QL285_059351 [Trifolium repens]WJX30117.1 hypothetical protein P8452_18690 [Trifolium repens]